jgi:hypothetical protein
MLPGLEGGPDVRVTAAAAGAPSGGSVCLEEGAEQGEAETGTGWERPTGGDLHGTA